MHLELSGRRRGVRRIERPLVSCTAALSARFLNSADNSEFHRIISWAVWTDPVFVPVVSATSSTSCARQSWHYLVTSRRLSCLGKRLTSIRLSPWSSAWETPNPCCPTQLTPTKRWWSCPAPGNCPSTPTLLPSSSPSSPSPPRSVGTGLTRRCYCLHHRLRGGTTLTPIMP